MGSSACNFLFLEADETGQGAGRRTLYMADIAAYVERTLHDGLSGGHMPCASKKGPVSLVATAPLSRELK